MFQTYQPPRHWWLRGRSISITIWPSWLAQKLCNHRGARSYPDIPDDEDVLVTACPDCYEMVESKELSLRGENNGA